MAWKCDIGVYNLACLFACILMFLICQRCFLDIRHGVKNMSWLEKYMTSKSTSWRRIALASAMEFVRSFQYWRFMSDQSFRQAFPMLNVKYWRIFRDVVSLFIQICIVSSDMWSIFTEVYWPLTYAGQIVLANWLWPHMYQGLWHWRLPLWAMGRFSNIDTKLKSFVHSTLFEPHLLIFGHLWP